MAKSVVADAMTDDDAALRVKIERMLEDVKRDRDDMNLEQEEIDRLKAQTRAVLAQLETALARRRTG